MSSLTCAIHGDKDQKDDTKILEEEDDSSTQSEKKFGQNYTDENNGNALGKINNPQEEEDHDNYVYIAKFSPLCKCTRNCLISYLVIVVLTSLLLALNVKLCGLDTPVHTMTIRNITALTGSYGIICPNYTKTCNFPTYMGTPDVVTNITQTTTVFGDNQNHTINILGNKTKLQLQSMPIQILINNTRNKTSSRLQTLKGISFYAPTTLQQIDNGGRISIDVNNSKRKRILTSSPYFNTGFWLDEFRFNGSGLNVSICSSYVSSYPVENINDTTPFIIQAPTNNTTQIPIWVINLDSVINANQECCMQNYTIAIAYTSFYCISPLVIRDLDDINVIYSEVRMVGDFILDFTLDRGFVTAYNSTINRLWLLRRTMTYYVYASRSTVTFLIPKNNKTNTTFYGIAGNITTTQGQRSLSRIEYNVMTNMDGKEKITIQVLDNTIDATLLSTISCALSNCTIVQITEGSTGSVSNIQFVQEDPTDSFKITIETGQRQILIE